MAIAAASRDLPDVGTPGSVGDVRRSNLALVLDRVAQARSGSHLTRAQIAAATGLTKASVSSIVLDLLKTGIIREMGLNPQGERGRPGVGLELNPARGVMGLEVNVDYIAAGVTDLSGTLVIQESRERDNRGSASGPVMSAIAALAGEMRQKAAAAGIDVLGGGLAVPGLVDAASSTIVSAPNLGWANVHLDLSPLLPGAPLDVRLFNEANAAALAELRYRPPGAADFLFVSGEVGVGGGVVIGSELFTGPHGHAGELGHVVVQPDGARCSCGGTGCLETLAGQDAIFAAAGLHSAAPSGAGDDGTPAAGYPSRSECLAQLKSALSEGDPRALAAVTTAGHSLGIAVAATVRLLNISSVVLSGHFAVLGDSIKPALLESLEKYAPGTVQPEGITLSVVGQSGAVLGAAETVLRSLLDAPHLLAGK